VILNPNDQAITESKDAPLLTAHPQAITSLTLENDEGQDNVAASVDGIEARDVPELTNSKSARKVASIASIAPLFHAS
jgi:hypothetical protein